MSDHMAQLIREGSGPWGTFGTLYINNWSCATLERRWLANERGRSCIPAGVYSMALRPSPVVERTSGGRFERGWEIEDVPDRTYIMFHPGNWERNSDGCLLVGRHSALVGDMNRGGETIPGITSSQGTFADLMEQLAISETWDIDIRWQDMGYP